MGKETDALEFWVSNIGNTISCLFIHILISPVIFICFHFTMCFMYRPRSYYHCLLLSALLLTSLSLFPLLLSLLLSLLRMPIIIIIITADIL